MTALPAVPPAETQRDGPDEEVDVWWGSYAGRDMAPSFGVCIGLTVAIYCGARWLELERGWLQLTFSGLAGSVWLVQLLRWSHRFFGWNYRLTTRYLYVDRGLRPLVAQRFGLLDVDRAEVCSSSLQKWLGIGDIVVWSANTSRPVAVLKALAAPQAAVETIREALKKAREDTK